MKQLTLPKPVLVLLLCASHVLFVGDATSQEKRMKDTPQVTEMPFGTTADMERIRLYTLTNRNDLEAKIINYGATLVLLKAPDAKGKFTDIVLGYDDLPSYEGDQAFLGSIVGRFANRIRGGQFRLDGKTYRLETNNGTNHLHGGKRGFNKRVWQAEKFANEDGSGVRLSYVSQDGEENYPGKLRATVIYTLTNADELKIEYEATTDRATVVNLTNHSYFNLAGKGNVLGHQLRIYADRYTPVDETSIPTGDFAAVADTPFDFREFKTIGERMNQSNEQLRIGKGYDHNFVLNKMAGELALAAQVYEPESGRAMEVWTTQPGLQFYSGNFLGNTRGKAGKIYGPRDGFCLEAQHYPDSPNQSGFPPVVLRPGEIYRQTTIYKFSVQRGRSR